MTTKVKKSLKFLKKSERKLLIGSIKKEKQLFCDNLQKCLGKEFTEYLKHLPLRKSVFVSANNYLSSNGVPEHLFDKLIHIFSSFNKGGSKYSKFQLEWYIFSGQCLDRTTHSAFDDILKTFEQTVLVSVPGSNAKDFRVYMSCVLRVAVNCFQKLIIANKQTKKNDSTASAHTVASFDDTSLYRMAGAMVRRMLRKRFSPKYFKRLTSKRQDLTKLESKLLRLMCLSKTEKMSSSSTLPVGFQVLDKGPLLVLKPCLFVLVALRPMSTAMVIAGRPVHLTTLFPGQAWASG